MITRDEALRLADYVLTEIVMCPDAWYRAEAKTMPGNPADNMIAATTRVRERLADKIMAEADGQGEVRR